MSSSALGQVNKSPVIYNDPKIRNSEPVKPTTNTPEIKPETIDIPVPAAENLFLANNLSNSGSALTNFNLPNNTFSSMFAIEPEDFLKQLPTPQLMRSTSESSSIITMNKFNNDKVKPSLWQSIRSSVSGTVSYARNQANVISANISNSTIGKSVSSAYNTTANNIQSVTNSISDMFSQVKDKFSKFLDQSAFAVGEKLRDVAELVEKIMPDPKPKEGKCYTAVKYSLASMGIPYVNSGDAYKSVNDIFSNPKYSNLFKKIEVDQADLKNLPAGAIIVWPKTAKSPSGHIGISDGKGKDISDVDRNALTNLRGNTKCQVFFPTGTLNPPHPGAVKIMEAIDKKSLAQMNRAKTLTVS